MVHLLWKKSNKGEEKNAFKEQETDGNPTLTVAEEEENKKAASDARDDAPKAKETEEAKPSIFSSVTSKMWQRRKSASEEEEGTAKDTTTTSSRSSITDTENASTTTTANSAAQKVSLSQRITEKLNIGKNSVSASITRSISSTTNDDDTGCSVLDRPSIYEESLEMLTAALLIYTFADLRQMAREGIVEASSPLLKQQPVLISHVVTVIQNHKEALEERAKSFGDMANRLTALKEIHDTQMQQQQQQKRSLMGSILQSNNPQSYKESYLASFHDETSTRGMVYGIAVNHLRQRITVIFRGSVTQQDFITDAKWVQKKIDNPVLAAAAAATTTKLGGDMENANNTAKAPKSIQIHTGFYQYMFQKDDDGKVRLEHILQDVKALLKENPGYKCYCTGHSLGGALATLCGFYAAQDNDIVQNGPVVVISIASPRVGDKQFRWAFQALEKMQRLQHLRISNKEDLVTLMPFLDIKSTAFSPLLTAVRGHAWNIYKHCGIHLECHSILDDETNDIHHKKPFHMSYVKDQSDEGKEEGSLYTEELKRSLEDAKALLGNLKHATDVEKATTFHSCDEYEARLATCKKYLETRTLDHLYSDETIVGATMASCFKKRPPMLK